MKTKPQLRNKVILQIGVKLIIGILMLMAFYAYASV